MPSVFNWSGFVLESSGGVGDISLIRAGVAYSRSTASMPGIWSQWNNVARDMNAIYASIENALVTYVCSAS